MKIYIGRIPEIIEENLLTDAWLYDMLKKYGHKDIGAMIESGIYDSMVLHTFNMVLLNYLTDDYAMDNIYYMKEGVLTLLRDDEHIVKKFEWGGAGEVLSDSHYILI